jgi:hypothetical protein
MQLRASFGTQLLLRLWLKMESGEGLSTAFAVASGPRLQPTLTSDNQHGRELPANTAFFPILASPSIQCLFIRRLQGLEAARARRTAATSFRRAGDYLLMARSVPVRPTPARSLPLGAGPWRANPKAAWPMNGSGQEYCRTPSALTVSASPAPVFPIRLRKPPRPVMASEKGNSKGRTGPVSGIRTFPEPAVETNHRASRSDRSV